MSVPDLRVYEKDHSLPALALKDKRIRLAGIQ
jgi:hypothetical protein